MQYGLLICKNTDNIGDDVQTYAQRRFLPRVDYYIDREHLDTFFPEKNVNEPVAVIMNAWYMYQKFNWPPSPYIYPLFISMHISKNDYFGIGTDFLNGLGKEYLNQYEPIGARDVNTLNIFLEKGIDAYLSGCLTLTIDIKKEKEVKDVIYLVDVDEFSERLIRTMYPNEHFIIRHHEVNYYDDALSYDTRMDIVESLLEEYQDAKCVVTTRLHCALPCLALKTPVLMLYEDSFEDRVKTFLPLLHYTTKENLEKRLTDFDLCNPPNNKNEYLSFCNALETKCINFIETAKKTNDTISEKNVEIGKSDLLQQIIWQKNLICLSEVQFRKALVSQHNKIQQLQAQQLLFIKEINFLKESEEQLVREVDSLKKELQYFVQENENKEQFIRDLESELTSFKDDMQHKMLIKDMRIWELQLENGLISGEKL